MAVLDIKIKPTEVYKHLLNIKDKTQINAIEDEFLGKFNVIYKSDLQKEKLKDYLVKTSMPFCVIDDGHVFKIDFDVNRIKLEKLWLENMTCCRICTSTKKMNLPFGCLNPDIMVIGECPGQANLNSSAVDRTMSYGKVANYVRFSLAELGYYKVWLTNMIKCSMADNKEVSIENSQRCYDWLFREICILQPKKIIVLGVSAARLFDINFSEEFKEDFEIYRVYHPSYFIRRGKKWMDYMKYLTPIIK